MSRLPISVAVNTASSGDTTLVSAITGHSIVVLGWLLQVDSAVDVTLKSGSTSLTGPMGAGANGGSVCPINPEGWCCTASGEALVINLSSAVQCSGLIRYEIVRVP